MPVPAPVPLATRSMKARWPGRCALCHGGPVLIGQRIARTPGRGWVHAACLIEARAAAEDTRRAQAEAATGRH